jgi:hypothetical protein
MRKYLLFQKNYGMEFVKRNLVTGDKKILHNEELHGLYP